MRADDSPGSPARLRRSQFCGRDQRAYQAYQRRVYRLLVFHCRRGMLCAQVWGVSTGRDLPEDLEHRKFPRRGAEREGLIDALNLELG
jgi:hypothetical protein